MGDLERLLQRHVDAGAVPGAVALVGRGDDVEHAVVGVADLATGAPMARDSIVRAASVGKLVTATAVMLLVEDGALRLDDPVARWLPELAEPVVVRTPSSPVDDVVPAVRPITVRHLMTSSVGWGFPSDFSWPAVAPLMHVVQRDGRDPQLRPPPDEWLALLARIPLLHQPGDGWLYNTSSDLQGVLLARVSGTPLPDLLQERVLGPLGMVDTGFVVPAADLDRFTAYYRPTADGLELADPPDGQWSSMPAFPAGSGGLVSTLDDLHALARMLVGGGEADGRRLLTEASVRQMATDHLDDAQRRMGSLFLDGQGWGYGGSVDGAADDPWTVPGRYGWVGGTGTSLHVVPSTGDVSILLTQVGLDGPVPAPLMPEFWTYAARA
ncbi:MAG: serine hydrolase domain-containing protein [Nocardioidaceae bacterium]|nr:serine hydrolase domain-containing protein [Nocardioidaceae bacterium]